MTWYLVDASTFITLSEIGRIHLIGGLSGNYYLPDVVADEIDSAETDLRWLTTVEVRRVIEMGDATFGPSDVNQSHFRRAANHLGRDFENDETTGDVALLGIALGWDELKSAVRIVVITDDKPLRKTCKALGIPISGSMGVLIAAVERGDLDPGEAKDALVSMDEVGARLSARLLRKAERLIDEAAEG